MGPEEGIGSSELVVVMNISPLEGQEVPLTTGQCPHHHPFSFLKNQSQVAQVGFELAL